jgi:hypothetical protein
MIVEEGETAVTRKEPVEQETSRGIRERLDTRRSSVRPRGEVTV